jgi:hypothetical protein
MLDSAPDSSQRSVGYGVCMVAWYNAGSASGNGTGLPWCCAIDLKPFSGPVKNSG